MLYFEISKVSELSISSFLCLNDNRFTKFWRTLYLKHFLVKWDLPLLESFIISKFGSKLHNLFTSLLSWWDFIILNISHLKEIFGKVFRKTCFMTKLGWKIDPSVSLVNIKKWLFVSESIIISFFKVLRHRNLLSLFFIKELMG